MIVVIVLKERAAARLRRRIADENAMARLFVIAAEKAQRGREAVHQKSVIAGWPVKLEGLERLLNAQGISREDSG